MIRTYIKDLNSQFGNTVLVEGFVDSLRDLQYVQFIVLKDITGKVQITIEKNEDNKDLNEVVSNITLDSTIKVVGVIQENEKVKLNGMEIIPNDINVTSESLSDLPYNYRNPDSAQRETRLDYRFLDIRRDENKVLFKVSTFIEQKMREFFVDNDFINIVSPKIIGAASEGGAEVFEIKYFEKKAYLAQSPQFYKQMAMASGLDKVFEFGTVFRAENSHTSYHSTEIYMVDMEVSFIKNHHDIMKIQEDLLKYVFSSLYDSYGDIIEATFNQKIKVPVNIPRITFDEAKRILKEEFNHNGEKIDDLDRSEEEKLCEYALNKYNEEFIFIIDWPSAARPFYHMLDENGKSMSYDLLYKGVEITTGAQREHRHDVLVKQIRDKNINEESLEFYLDFFKYGCPPHGGFGFGFYRLIMKMLNFDNIREVSYIYRGPNRLNP